MSCWLSSTREVVATLLERTPFPNVLAEMVNAYYPRHCYLVTEFNPACVRLMPWYPTRTPNGLVVGYSIPLEMHSMPDHRVLLRLQSCSRVHVMARHGKSSLLIDVNEAESHVLSQIHEAVQTAMMSMFDEELQSFVRHGQLRMRWVPGKSMLYNKSGKLVLDGPDAADKKLCMGCVVHLKSVYVKTIAPCRASMVADLVCTWVQEETNTPLSLMEDD